ncbi:MAG: hypothetical protein AAF191_09485 [Verrucomicrobiota bacterium]
MFDDSSRLARWCSTLWFPVLTILVLGMVAHGHALRATFFMDDALHITGEHNILDHFGGWMEREFRWLPSLIWERTAAAVGYSAPAFHAWTLGTHLLIGALLFPFSTALLARIAPGLKHQRSIAWCAALLFVCHPLTTEPVHYARCFMIDLVTLFTMLSAWSFLRWWDCRSWRNFGLLLAMVSLAMVSKQPGVLHALGVVGILAVTQMPWRKELGRLFIHHPRVAWGVIVGFGIALAWVPWGHHRLFGQPQFIPNVLTQTRVFWEYAALLFVPVGQSVDHLRAWTTDPRDPAFLLAATALLIGTGGAVWGVIRFPSFRPVAILLALGLWAVFLRFLYVSPETMVEYRMYPAMPFLSIALGWGLWRLAQLPWRGMRYAVPVILLALTTLSWQRSVQWTEATTLAASAAQTQPENLRALGSLQYAASQKGNFQAAVQLKPFADEALANLLKHNETHRWRKHEISRPHLWYETFLRHHVAAIANLQGPEIAFAQAETYLATLREEYPNFYPRRNSIHHPLLDYRNRLEAYLCEQSDLHHELSAVHP